MTEQKRAKVSRLSMAGGILFLLTILALTVMVTIFSFTVNSILFRLIVGLLIVELLIFALGVVIDRLSIEGFEFWAFGAIITYVGILAIFSPLVIWIMTNTIDITFSLGLIVIGVFIIFFGYFTEAYDLNKKLAKAIRDLLIALRNYNYREGFKALIRLISQVVLGFFAYIKRGIIGFRTTMGNFLRRTGGIIKRFSLAFVAFLIAIPPAIYNFCTATAKLVVANIHVIGVAAGALFFVFSLTGLTEPFTGLAVLFFCLLFFAVKAAYPRKEQLIQIAVRTRDRVWETSYQINYRLRTVAENRRKIKCLNCGEEIPLGSRECGFCEKEVERCMICKLPIKSEQKSSECPHCKNPAHEEHWKFWIDLKHSCPACKQEVSTGFQPESHHGTSI
ncbi:MAG: hypothetical protein ACFFD4_27920 [Candidatus Odinarchaeota archaeon]